MNQSRRNDLRNIVKRVEEIENELRLLAFDEQDEQEAFDNGTEIEDNADKIYDAEEKAQTLLEVLEDILCL